MDIVQRLLNPPAWARAFAPELKRAADEIERLRRPLEMLARLATLEDKMNEAEVDETEGEVADQMDEIEPARQTLDYWIKEARKVVGEKP